MIPVEIGSPVPLAAQLKDQSEIQKVTAEIINMKDSVVARVELVHSTKGLYTSLEYAMPDEPLIRARYIISNSKKYGVAMDTFIAIKKPEVKVIEHFIEGYVIKETEIDDCIIGVVTHEIEN